MNLLAGTFPAPPEYFILTLPNGRFAAVKVTGRSLSGSGLIDTISGPAVTLAATLQAFAAIFTNAGFFDPSVNGFSQAKKFGIPVIWSAQDFPLRQFNFRGTAWSGIQQLAANIQADVFIYKNTAYTLQPGQLSPDGLTFTYPKSDLISASQNVDYNDDKNVIFNPAAVPIQFEGIFMYDALHAVKQPKQTVICGAPKGNVSQDLLHRQVFATSLCRQGFVRK